MGTSRLGLVADGRGWGARCSRTSLLANARCPVDMRSRFALVVVRAWEPGPVPDLRRSGAAALDWREQRRGCQRAVELVARAIKRSAQNARFAGSPIRIASASLNCRFIAAVSRKVMNRRSGLTV